MRNNTPAKEEDRANSEGWNILQAPWEGIEVYEIECNDTNAPPHENAQEFESDWAAIAYVAQQARRGSAFHRKALRIHRNWRRFWRAIASEPDFEGLEAPPGPTNEWFDFILTLLASAECSEAQRRKCAAAFETIRKVASKLARTELDKEACEMLNEYLIGELADV